MKNRNDLRIAFFGTPDFAVTVLDALEAAGLTPALVVTTPDVPLGRKKVMTSPPAKTWALSRGIHVVQPERLSKFDFTDFGLESFDIFVLASYGKIVPQKLLDAPKHGVLNVHPSLLPKFRGASPVQNFILSGEDQTGVTIMLTDAEMDHGPVLAQESLQGDLSHETYTNLKNKLALLGGRMLTEVIPRWVAGEIGPRVQDHSAATFTAKITTEDGHLLFDRMSPQEIDRRVRALNPDPGTFAFFDVGGDEMRIKILESEVRDGQLLIKRVKPDGKNEMSWDDFKRGHPIIRTAKETAQTL